MGVKNYVGELQLNGKQVATVDQIPSLSYSEGLRYRKILAWDTLSTYVSGSGTCTDTKIIIPSLLKDGDKIVGIYEKAFYNNTNITSVVISEGIVSIREYAFSGCTNLTSITIPNSVTWIAEGAFSNCPKLNNIILPNKITSIGNSAFEKCTSLTSIVIPDGVTSIGNYAFDSCTNLKHVTFSNNLTSIGNYAFDDCASLANIELPNSLQSIGDYAFSENALINVTIPNSVTDIGNHAFQYCRSLESVMIPKSVVNMGENVFIMGNNTTLYCEAEAQPDTWNTAWKDTNYPVVWGSVMDFEGVNDVFNATKEIEGIKTKSISATSATFGENDEISIGTAGIGMVEGATLTIGGVDVIGNIGQALDAILAIQKELIPTPKLITFYINHYGSIGTYQAVEGQTFGDWCGSEYDTLGCRAANYVYAPDGIAIISGGTIQYNPDENTPIEAEVTYTFN